MANAISSWSYPQSLIIAGKEYGIKSDYRAVIKIFTALNDYELLKEDSYVQCGVILSLFYDDYESIPLEHWQEALDQMKEFIDMGIEEGKEKTKLMDWDKDAPLIRPQISQILGYEVLEPRYTHWWSFLGAYMNIGECLFSTVINIRQKKAKGKKLEKYEQEFYSANKALIDLNVSSRSQEEKDELRAYFGYKK